MSYNSSVILLFCLYPLPRNVLTEPLPSNVHIRHNIFHSEHISRQLVYSYLTIHELRYIHD
jgi:hypothetical protein